VSDQGILDLAAEWHRRSRSSYTDTYWLIVDLF